MVGVLHPTDSRPYAQKVRGFCISNHSVDLVQFPGLSIYLDLFDLGIQEVLAGDGNQDLPEPQGGRPNHRRKMDGLCSQTPTRRVLVLHGPWVCRRLSSGLAMELFDLFDRPRFNFPDPRHRAIHSYSRIPLCKVLVLSHSG